ncbi:non-ribosomal peptide synthase/polyketide synthase [Amycolatopsis sp. OK19-0408]|uniref:Non-ribosomal peptide synthase/polyketide synthase n=1 Tax=Amycolatopsis iheyensis TaxID=2945988 RepID=A0A9X2NB38_9PSEU|nr:non-ribosomal peptide synthase/polyketide synthase [Amycolatopsis iheyensis]MCR6483860.1 non-ribosomal peptide synthase/polyketide synthase [Amycolatopsis iheyensis]
MNELELITVNDDARQLLAAWNDTTTDVPEAGRTLTRLLAEQAARTPDATALVFEGESLTYRALHHRADGLAHLLVERGVGPGVLTGVCADRSLELVVALLGVLKAGGAYVPLDPDYPADRLAYMVADSAAPVVLTQRHYADRFAAETILLDETEIDCDANPATAPEVSTKDLAYAIYTSGSTGRPKGVLVPHEGIVNRLTWTQAQYGLTAEDRVLQKTPSSFDVSVWEFFWPLLTGATLVVARPGGHRDPAYLAEVIRAERITTVHFVPSMLQAFLLDPAAATCTGLRRVLCSGEALPAELQARFFATLPGAELHNLYGPTEASVDVTYWACAPAETTVPIGRPVWNTRTYVLDAGLRPVAPGEAGELYLAGIQLARGYHGRPGLTAERFVASPFADGERMYRTGDLARWDETGALHYLGRTDHQVKIRGLRVELGEIEAVLDRQPGVGGSCVLAREDRAGDQRLVGYLVPDGAAPDVEALRAVLAEHLPEYMVPAAFVVLDELPLTPSGKLDRKALPAPDWAAARTGRAPRTPREAALCTLFSEVLGVEGVGIDDGFLALGGHSLLAAKLVSGIRATLGLEAAIGDVFRAPTPAALAEVLETAAPARVPLTPRRRPEPMPLSFAQRRLWFLDQADTGNASYHVPQAVRLTGPIDAGVLRSAIGDVLTRHEALRTIFTSDGEEPVQHILPGGEVPWTRQESTEDTLATDLTAATEAGFDLARELPIRATLFDLPGDTAVLLLVVHHIACDGWSMAPLLRQVGEAYAARIAGVAPQWTPLPVQYADYTLWQRELPVERDLAYWRDALAGLPEELPLPADRPRPAVASHRGGVVPMDVPADVHRKLAALAADEGATLFMVLQAAFAALLTRLGAGDDVPVGSPVAGRTDTALDDLVGFFVNTVVLRTATGGDPTFRELLDRARETCLAAFEHSEVPFERVVEELNPARSLGRHPLFQVLLVLQNNLAAELDLDGVRATGERVDIGYAKFDLAAIFEERDGELTGLLEYASDLFDRDTAAALAGRLLRVLTAVAERPDTRLGDLDLLDAAEHAQATTGGMRAPGAPAVTLHEVIEGHARRTPEATALLFEAETITYAELDARANGVASLLSGIPAGRIVAIGLDRGPDLVAAILGVLKAGCGYTLLDPSFPAERRQLLAAQVDAPVVLDDLSFVEPTTAAPRRAVSPAGPACVMFTSGSTGTPKGVVASHEAVTTTILGQGYGGDVWLQTAPVSWDAFAFELFGALLTGAACVLQPGPKPEPALIAELVARHDVTTMFASASLLNFLLDEYPAVFEQVREVYTGGEAASVAHLTRAVETFPDVAFTNAYGPVENMIFVSAHRVTRADLTGTPIPIGVPLHGKRAYVLDERLRPVAPGVVGELYAAGGGIADGYVGRPDLTAVRFVASPFEAGARLYRTGDLVRRRADGVLEYVGRADDQVKIRGFRVEPGEIRTALGTHPAVTESAVVVREDRPGQKLLVAYVVGEPTDFRAHLAERLPEHLVPSAFVLLDTLPLTANGKLDRRALPAPERTSTNRAPRTPREEVLCGLFADVLGAGEVGVDDGFFALGGHSLLAARLVARIGAVLGARIGVADVFRAPTVAALAAVLDSARAARPAVVARPRPAVLPLSSAQRSLWFVEQLEEAGAAYNVPRALRLTGDLDVAALRQAFADVLERHEALRTVFPSAGGVPRQEIRPVTELPWTEGAVDVAEFAARAFDLATDLPIRAALVPDGNAHVLVVVTHHIASDGWSFAPLLRDLSAAYTARTTGDTPQWTSLPVQYADYALWQQDLTDDSAGYWADALAGLPDEINLPFDHPRPPVASHRGATLPVTLDADLHARLLELARGEHATLFMVLQAGFAALLSRLGAGEDVAIGTPSAGRPDAALDDLVGFFVTTLVLRTDLGGDPTFTELVHRVRETSLKAFDHADVPFERVVERLNPARSTARHPLFQVMLALQNNVAANLALPGLTAADVPVSTATAKFDLTLNLEEHTDDGRPAGIGGYLEYATDLVEPGTAADLADRFARLLAAAVEDPAAPLSTVDLLAPAEAAAIDPANAGTAVEVPDTSVIELFEAQAASTPDAPALEFGATTLTYAELNARANRLARHLAGRGAGPERYVALSLPRDEQLVVAMLAVLKTGAGYLALDLDYPADRLAMMLEDADPALVLTRDELVFEGPAENPRHTASPDSPAYVIFTSGSTGRPKGVVVPRRPLLNFLLDMVARFGITAGDRLLAVTTVGFDIAGLEIFAPLLAGATVVLASRDDVRDSRALAALAEDATFLQATPSLFHALLAEPADLSGVHVLVGGEALPDDLAVALRARAASVTNMYGPTETTIWSTTARVGEGSPTIGTPIANTQVYVLDRALRPVPPGVPGELYLAGDGVVRGYLGRPDLTADRFVANPFADGERMYRTGDLVARRRDGELRFLGRVDHQVKIRGFRIELGEIETVLAAHPAVALRAVVVREDRPGDKRLVAYVVPGAPVEAEELRRHLAAALPGYMVPSAFVLLDELPRTPNGKLDRKALPAPAVETGAGRVPRTATELALCELFAEVLGVPEVGVDDGFFDLGGHSLLATRLTGRIRAVLGLDVTVRALFANPTVAGLSESLGDAVAARPAVTRRTRPDRLPLAPGQERLWFLARLDPADTAYHMPMALRLRGEVDTGALAAALSDVAGRHEALRTYYAEDESGLHQVILDSFEVPFEIGAGSVADAARTPFDLAAAPPVRSWLFSEGDEHVLLVLTHHIAGDGWSIPVLLGDLADAYAARLDGHAPEWTPLPVQYADYTLWQRELDSDLTYWTDALAGLPEELALPYDRVRPATADHTGGSAAVTIPAELHSRLLALATGRRATLFMVLQAALATLLARFGAGDDIPIGTPVAGRPDPVLDDLVGFFVNTVVLRTDLGGAPAFTELLDRVREADLGAFEHDDVPFERLVEELNPARSAARHPLFQVMLVLQQDAPAPALSGVECAPYEVTRAVAKFDLTAALEEHGDGGGITGAFEYATALFDAATAERLATAFVRLLEQIADAPSTSVTAFDVLTTAERDLVLASGHAAGIEPLPVDCLHTIVERQDPEAVAILFEGESLTYGELNTRANQVAHHLLDDGIRRGEVVGVLMERGFDFAIAVLGVLKSGAAYTLLDPSYPAERLAAVTEQAGVKRVLKSLPSHPDTTNPAVELTPADLACVMFTSGSTGVPKGVATSHRGVVATMGQGYATFDADQVWLQCAPVSWDGFALQLFGALLYGGRTVLQPGQNPEPERIAALVVEHGVTVLHASASLFNYLLDQEPQVFAVLRRAMTGGEPASVGHVTKALREYPDVALINGYGPAESMGYTTFHPITEADLGGTAIPIGRPVASKRAYVLDPQLNLAAPGVTGELYLAGHGLADGYRGLPAATAERFVANPFAAGERMYRTGDLVRWRADGVLEYVGRADDQVKVRGFRVEPGEVRAVLARYDGVEQAAVVVRDGRLIGYVVGSAEPAALRAYLADRLPDYLVPSAIVPLDALPRTANGKLDRRALPAPDFAAASRRRPRTRTENVLCGLFADVLGLPEVGLDDGFFDLGGHSLLAARLIGRVRAVLGVELGIRDLFRTPAVAGLAEVLGDAAPARPPVTRRERPQRLPLSFAQQRLWFVDQAEEANAGYDVPRALRLRGSLDVPALQAALADVVERHESLRTVYPSHEGEPWQEILTAPAVPWTLTQSTEDALDDVLAEAAAHVFDLRAELPIRAHLVSVSADDHVLLLVLHHIASDGWSAAPLWRDLATAYPARLDGHAPDWAPLPVQYVDYTLWQREVLDEAELTDQLAFWRDALTGAPEELALPADRVRPAVASHRGGSVEFTLDADVHRGLADLARGSGATLFMALQAGFAALLSRLGAGDDVPLGTAVAGRGDTALDDLAGFFVNTLVLRTDVSGQPTFRQLLARVRDAGLAALAHADVPFERVVEELNPARSAARHPLFQVMLVLQNNATARLSLPGLATEGVTVRRDVAKFDLTAGIEENHTAEGHPAGLTGQLEYAADLFDTATATSIAQRFARFLTAAVATPDVSVVDLDVLGAGERAELLAHGTTEVTAPAMRLHDLVERQAQWAPDATALLFEGTPLTYGQLDTEANRLARHLVAEGVRHGDLVGVHIGRSPRLAVALLAVLKAGAAYTVLDTDFPADRLVGALRRTSAAVVVTDGRDLPWRRIDVVADAAAIAVRDGGALGLPGSPDDLAVVMFTSGSTGVPKAVAAPHRAVVGTLTGQDYAGFGPDDVWLQCAPVSWDAFGTQLLGPLLAGGTVVLQPGQRPEPALIEDLVLAHDVTVLDVSASLFDFLVDEHPAVFGTVRRAMTGGEAASPAHLAKVLREYPHVAVINGYGPAETMGFSTFHQVKTVDGPVPIGRPLTGKHAYVLDSRLRPVPAGVVGELYLSGVGTALGYLGAPGATAERFVASPFAAGARMYRTGDLARWTAEGVLEYAGRTDDQVKIRGFRVEPGEVQAVLAAHEGVTQVAVVVRDGLLVAYVVGTVDPAVLSEFAAARLPEHLVPSVLVPLAELPRTANGKLDRAALPAPRRVVAGHVAPRTPIEIALAAIWADVLGVPSPGVEDNFFALGGHSLLAAKVTGRMRTEFGVRLGVRALFEAPTIAALARLVPAASTVDFEPIPVRPAGARTPLSPVQRGLWFAERLAPGSAEYLVPLVLRVGGDLDVGALASALSAVVARHEVLRSRFLEVDGEPVQVVDPVRAVLLPVTEVPDIDAFVRSQLENPLDLEHGPVCRAALGRVSEREHVLVLVMHHIVADGWSMGVLAADLRDHYAGTRPAALPVQFGDVAAWQAAASDEAGLAFWQRALAGMPHVAELPTDRPRPLTRDIAGAKTPVHVPAEVVDRLQRLGAEHGASLFMTVLAAFEVLISRYTALRDFAIGTPVSGRGHPQTEPLIGHFVNTVPLRADLTGDPAFTELLARVRTSTLAAFDHDDVPFDRIVELLRPQRDLTRTPLVQIVFALQNNEEAGWALAGLDVEKLAVDTRVSKFDLELALAQDADGALTGIFEYPTALFDATTIERMAGHFTTLLSQLAEAPETPVGELNLLSRAERNHLVHGVNDTVVAYDESACLHHLITEQARRTPGAIAVEYLDESIGYAELDRRAGVLAARLVEHGVGPDVPVGLRMDRSIDLIVGLVAILKAGGAFVPIETDAPEPRVLGILGDAHSPVCLVNEGAPSPQSDRVAFLEVSGLDGEAPELPDTAHPDNLVSIYYTSGSTGKPKGVASTHRGWVNRLRWHQDTYRLQPGESVLQKTTLVFDDAAVECLWPLIVGGRVALIPPGLHRDPAAILAGAIKHRVANLQFVPSMLTLFLEQLTPADRAALKTVRNVITSGEALQPELLKLFFDRLGDTATLHNQWGATEVSIDSTMRECLRSDLDGAGSVSVGSPIANNQIHVLDEHLRPVPIGVPGDLFIGGVGLARGYLGDARKTASAFLASPFEPGERLYRTGDRGLRTPDGALTFLGRQDSQVKIRGIRVEPGEVEQVLLELPGVREAAVTVWQPVPGDKRLAGYVTPQAGVTLTEGEIREQLRARLPVYLVPTALSVLPEFPTTTSGKIDRKALPAPAAAGAEYRAPEGPVAELVAGVLQHVLGVERVGADDNFFDLGGHSLLGVRVVAELRKRLSADIPIRLIFDSPTVAELADAVSRATKREFEAIPKRPDGPAPLAGVQVGMWLADRMAPSSAEYLVPNAVRLRGPLDVDALSAALTKLVQRHEILRTRFVEIDGEPKQVVDPAGPVPLPVTEIDAIEPFLALRGIDLATGPVFAAALGRLAEDDHVLVLSAHHIVLDGWSEGLLAEELRDLYAGADLPPLPVQYADVAAWSQPTEAAVEFWRAQLAGVPQVVQLPTDRPRPPVRDPRGARYEFTVPAALATRLGEVGAEARASLFMTLLAGFQVLVSRHTGLREFAIGSPVAGRDHPDTERLIGQFVNTLALRADLTGSPGFGELLERVRETALNSFSHQEVPIDRVVAELRPDRDPSRNPLIQLMFALQTVSEGGWELAGLDCEPLGVETGAAKFDLAMVLREQASGEVGGVLEYPVALFDEDTVAAFADRYLRLLAGFAADPARPVDRVPMLDAAELAPLAGTAPGGTFAGLVEAQVRRTPDAPAVVAGPYSLTYAELDAAANRVARVLRERGAAPETVVALLLPRSADLVVAQLAVVKTGAAFLPIDPSYPAERIRYMLDDADPVLTLRELPESTMDDSSPAVEVRPENAAYVIYTSGSTGRPKGVVVSHAGLGTLVANTIAAYRVGPGDRVLQYVSPSFDASILELCASLMTGAALVVTPPGPLLGDQLRDVLAEGRVTHALIPPAALATVEDPDLPDFRTVVVGGDVCPPELVAKWAPGRRMLNMYGPTEATVVSTVSEPLVVGAPVTIGAALKHTQAYVLDDRLQPVPPGVAGELYVASPGLARGYLGRPGLTASRFVANPAGGRMYRTGDLVRRTRAGDLEFLGRTDDQVKIRGFRIELGEVESALRAHPALTAAVVLAKPDPAGQKRLVAYVAGDVTGAELRTFLGQRLPEHLVPSAFVVLDALPVTTSGKLDRAALPEPAEETADYVAPSSPEEQLIADIWAEVLGVPRVGLGDDFFALGGHSVLAAKVRMRLQAAFGVDLALPVLFQTTTVAALAAVVHTEIEAELAGMSEQELLDSLSEEASA